MNSRDFYCDAIVSFNVFLTVSSIDPTLPKNKKSDTFLDLCKFKKIILNDEFKGTGTSLQLDVKFP